MHIATLLKTSTNSATIYQAITSWTVARELVIEIILEQVLEVRNGNFVDTFVSQIYAL